MDDSARHSKRKRTPNLKWKFEDDEWLRSDDVNEVTGISFSEEEAESEYGEEVKADLGSGHRQQSSDSDYFASERFDNFQTEDCHDGYDDADMGSVSSKSNDSETTVSSGGLEICCVCGGGHDAKTLMQCSLCANWIHLQCWNIAQGTRVMAVPEDDIVCTSREVCLKGFNKLMDLGLVDAMSMDDYDSGDAYHSAFHQEELEFFLKSTLGCEQLDSATGSASERSIVKLLSLKEHNPMAFASIYMWAEKRHGLSRDAYNIILDSLFSILAKRELNLSDRAQSLLRKMAPPANIRRVLESCSERTWHSVLLTQNASKKVEAFFVLHFADVIDAAFDLHCSNVLTAAGPYYRWDDQASQCSAKHIPDFSDRIRQFCDYYSLDHTKSNIVVIPVYLYADESISKSGNRTACPLWMTSALIDPNVRAILGVKAHTLLSLLPVASAIDFRFKGTSDAKYQGREQARGQIEGAHTGTRRDQLAGKLRLKAYQAIFAQFQRLENTGRQYVLRGESVTVRIMVVNVILDMKERRFFLDLRRNTWHCMTCYDHPGKSIEAGRAKVGTRTTKQDERFRAQFREGVSRLTCNENPDGKKVKVEKLKPENQFKQEYGQFGINLKDNCPVTAVPDLSIFMINGPSELCITDLLHNKDGVILRYMKMLIAAIGSNFVQQTMQYGNEFLCTKRFAMHVMERGIESFHFIPLGIMFGAFDPDVDTTSRRWLFLGSCDLLKILGLLNDPCPGFILGELREAIKRFEQHVHALNARIVNVKKEKPFGISTKMHELFTHVADQVATVGYLPALSSKMFETFHKDVFEIIGANSSGRMADGTGSKEVLLAFTYRHNLAEMDAVQLAGCNTGSGFIGSNGWQPEVKVTISMRHEKKKQDFETVFKANFQLVTQIFNVITASLATYPVTNEIFGDTLRIGLKCRLRSTSASLEDVLVVPGTGLGMFTSGGASNCIAFGGRRDADDETWSARRCRVSGCNNHFHTPDLQLFCSSIRDVTSSYGVPVIFVESGVYVVPLKRVESNGTIPENDAIIEMQCDFSNVELVHYSKVRGTCMLRPHHDRKYPGRAIMFRFRRVFGYKGL